MERRVTERQHGQKRQHNKIRGAKEAIKEVKRANDKGQNFLACGRDRCYCVLHAVKGVAIPWYTMLHN
jgi:predicted helicase